MVKENSNKTKPTFFVFFTPIFWGSVFLCLNSKKITKMLSRKIIIDPFEVIVDKLLIKNNKKYFSINKRI